MQQLVRGIHYFQNIGFREREKLFQRLQHGQKPEACMITCADSRINPNLITHAEPGEIFIIRNVGDLVPCFGTSNNGELAAAEYAIVELGIQDLIVCGHTCCGPMKALVDTAPQPIPARTPLVSDGCDTPRPPWRCARALWPSAGKRARRCGCARKRTRAIGTPAHPARDCLAHLHRPRQSARLDVPHREGRDFQYESEVGQFIKFGANPEAAEQKSMVAGRRGKNVLS